MGALSSEPEDFCLFFLASAPLYAKQFTGFLKLRVIFRHQKIEVRLLRLRQAHRNVSATPRRLLLPSGV